VESCDALLEAQQSPTGIERQESYRFYSYSDHLLCPYGCSGYHSHNSPRQRGSSFQQVSGWCRTVFLKHISRDMKWISKWRFAISGIWMALCKGCGFAFISVIHPSLLPKVIDSFKGFVLLLRPGFLLLLEV